MHRIWCQWQPSLETNRNSTKLRQKPITPLRAAKRQSRWVRVLTRPRIVDSKVLHRKWITLVLGIKLKRRFRFQWESLTSGRFSILRFLSRWILELILNRKRVSSTSSKAKPSVLAPKEKSTFPKSKINENGTSKKPSQESWTTKSSFSKSI